MAQRHQLYELQKEIGDEIANILVKLESGNVRGASLAQYKTRIDNLEEKFRNNDEKLIKMGETSEDYFQKNYSEMVKEMCDRCKIALHTDGKAPKEAAAYITREELKEIMKQQFQEFLQIGSAQAEKRNTSNEDATKTEQTDGKKSVRFAEGKTASALLIRFRKEIQKLEESLSSPNEENILILENKRSSWEKKMVCIRDIYHDLTVNHCVEDDIEEELEQIDEQYEEALNNILLKLSALQEEKKAGTLEAIKIPIFNGNIEEWLSFRNMFNQFVHKSKLPAVEKLIRLKNHVRGEALKIIQNLPITENNYEAAREILNQRYDNKRILFTKLVDKILDQPNTNINSDSNLRQLINTTNESIQGLKSMGVKLEDADPIIARIILKKLDKDGLILYEQSTKKSKDVQKLTDVMQFIELQCEALEASLTKKDDNRRQIRATMLSTENGYCIYCKKDGHKMKNCTKFLTLTVEGRNTWVRNAKICNLCLNHKMDKRCFQKTKCQKCGKMHNTTLHIDYKAINKTPTNQTTNSMNTKAAADVLLATAQVKIKSVHGEEILLRALIDHGSQVTTVSEEVSQILALPRIKSKTEIYGLGGAVVGISKAKIKMVLKPRFLSNQFVEAEALILPQLTGAHPIHSFKFNESKWKNLLLADPALNKSDRIDIVIGMDIITNIMEKGLIKREGILAQSTIFGWILSGIVSKRHNSNKALVATTNLERFWELEELSSDSTNYEEDKICLDLFNDTTKVDEDKRIVVNLPIKNEDNQLGNSKKQALARLLSLERKLDANAKLREDYNKFLQDYLQMGHMKLVNEEGKGKYYLPHQAVIREKSLTTKLRVVFDASAKSSNNKSLNDIMYTGPRLQRDIFDILVKWRLWKYVVTADVEKMYRQIKVASKHQSYQHILWRENKKEKIREYKLTTVTYGTSSAPFLAVRALFYIADNCQNKEISNIIKEDFYMDDLMTGADTIAKCKEIYQEVCNHLAYYGFMLRKWLSNDLNVFEQVNTFSENAVIQIKDDEAVKTLGLQWDPIKDNFQFNIEFLLGDKLTKRKALAEVAKIFDPLGWLSPVTIVAKLFVQKLWLLDSKWDDPLSDDIKKEWQQFINDVTDIQRIRVPRWLQVKTNQLFELHGFADASEKAYAAVIYLKTDQSVKLLAAKTKVNPIKNRKTLPKLELCAANLLSKLLHKVSNILNRQHSMYAWSDSTITLAWIANKKNKDRFVRNRVAEIINLIPDANWKHVCSKENPADIASRGISAYKLATQSLWWNGPEWLILSSSRWPRKEETEKVMVAVTIKNDANLLKELCHKYSSFAKLTRVMAYIIRFIKILRKISCSSKYLSVKELKTAEIKIWKFHQEVEFQEEIADLRRNGLVSRNSKIVSLYPFIDKDGLLRVGGRLHNANLSYGHRHPIIVRNSFLASLLVKEAHLATLHGGNRLVESTLKRQYWMLDMKNCIKKYIRNCSKCIRYGQENSKQLMGSLPEPRVTISAPFQHVGVDYAGPIQLRCSKGRGQKSYKGYIAVFVCMATKAIHLEAVSDLTSEAFLAALKRFFGRRGVCSDIYSDNGTNFVGANRKLDEDFKAAVRNNESLIPILASQKIRWHFIPPAAPHFGGIWEAGVKSVKFHLRRTIGESKLTYEEMSTLLIQIEAVLNSRPLVGLDNDDGSHVDVLTPGHFLIGRPLKDCPEYITETSISSLNRWKLIQKLRRDFWVRWKNEYLSTLQQRNKWKFPTENLKEGTIVLIKDENTNPASWPLGKVAATHCGKDGKARVVTLKLPNGVLKRPINKLVPLVAAEEKIDISPPARSCLTKLKSPAKGKLNWTGVLPQILLILLLLIKSSKGLPVKTNEVATIEELSPNTAVYINNIGQLNLINSRWNLVVYYELSLYFEELSRTGILIGKLENECPKLGTYEESCQMIMSAMKRRYKLLMQNNELFNSKPRKKRAPFEFVGSIYHILFGMMDSNDREQMEANMRNLFDNQQDLNALIKQQTSIVDSTLNVLKKTTEDVNRNFNQMYKQLKYLYEEIENEKKSDHLTVFFLILSTQLNLMIDECEKIQSSVINILIDVNHRHINTDLLTPVQLHKELMEIEKVIPKDLAIPGKATGTELKEVYHEMEAKGIIVDKRLVVQVEIPLIQVHSPEVYELIKLPINMNSTVAIPIVEDEFIAYNFASNRYCVMSQAKLNSCGRTLQGQYNCVEDMPWKSAIERSCEVSALKQSRHAECTFEAFPRKPVWKKLASKNKWIFTVFDNFVLTVDCGQANRSWVTLPSKGLLTLSAGCTAIYEGITMKATKEWGSSVRADIQASVWKLDPDKMNPKLVKPFDVAIINNTDDINHLKMKVQNMRDSGIDLRRLHFHTVSGHISLVLIIVIIIICIGFAIRKNCCKSTEVVKINFSTPLPLRSQTNVPNVQSS